MSLSFCVPDLGIVCVLESQAKVVSLQQVQMATHHVQQGLAPGKFLVETHSMRAHRFCSGRHSCAGL